MLQMSGFLEKGDSDEEAGSSLGEKEKGEIILQDISISEMVFLKINKTGSEDLCSAGVIGPTGSASLKTRFRTIPNFP